VKVLVHTRDAVPSVPYGQHALHAVQLACTWRFPVQHNVQECGEKSVVSQQALLLVAGHKHTRCCAVVDAPMYFAGCALGTSGPAAGLGRTGDGTRPARGGGSPQLPSMCGVWLTRGPWRACGTRCSMVAWRRAAPRSGGSDFREINLCI
jgi:hypothetical protein